MNTAPPIDTIFSPKQEAQKVYFIENGYIYVAQPPLYGVKQGQGMKYLLDDRALASFLLERNMDKIKLIVNGKIVDSSEMTQFIGDLFAIGSDIENPKTPDRTGWLNELSYCEWFVDEIEKGEPWQRIRSIIK